MGFKTLRFFARYLAGRLERPAVLPCVVQSPFGVEQALRYHSLGPLESGAVQPT